MPETIGHFRVVRQIGEGGMGVVYEAWDERLGRAVAIKTICGTSESQEGRRQLWREARSLARVSHPRICQLFDAVEDGEALFLVMELLEGQSLDRRLAGGRPPTSQHRLTYNPPCKEFCMKIGINTPGIHHVALRSSDLLRSKSFYALTLGFPLILESENLFIFLAGATAIGVRGPDAATPAGDAFSPFRVGLDHLALGCAEEAELERVAAGLSAAGVANTGVKLDLTLNKKYVAFKDPDGIAWELFMQ